MSQPDATRPSAGLAIASLVLGILSLVLSVLLVGGLLGVIGLALGSLHLGKRILPNRMAKWGIGLSIFGVLATLGFGAIYYSAYRSMVEIMKAASQREEPDFSQWEGVLAPDFTVTTLEGQSVQLSALKGKRVLLDFWATWCPPCVREIPHLVQLRDQTSNDTLVIVGISEEDASTLKNFVRQKGINYPVASAGNLPAPYSQVRSIPTTFFIDRRGIIQEVAVGYHDYVSLKTAAVSADFEGEARSAPAPPPELPEASSLLKPSILWSTNVPGAEALCTGDWEGNGSSDILVAAGSTLHVFSWNGQELRRVPLPGRFAFIECGLDKVHGTRLLGYSNWGHSVTVVDAAGKELWHVGSLFGVDGAHWGDLDGDGADEVIVGMNGGGGLQAWSSEGKKLWSASLGNVWNQAILPASGGSPARVFATEAGGSVRVFGSHGEALGALRPQGGYYAQMSACRGPGGSVQIAAVHDNRIVVFDDNGKVEWTTTTVQDRGGWRTCSFASGDLVGDGGTEWVFVDGSGAMSVATTGGERVASIPNSQEVKALAVARRPNQPGLLVTLQGGTVEGRAFAR